MSSSSFFCSKSFGRMAAAAAVPLVVDLGRAAALGRAMVGRKAMDLAAVSARAPGRVPAAVVVTAPALVRFRAGGCTAVPAEVAAALDQALPALLEVRSITLFTVNLVT